MGSTLRYKLRSASCRKFITEPKLEVRLTVRSPNHSNDDETLILPNPLPQPSRVVKAEEPTAQKRSAPDDDDDEIIEEPPTKRARTNGTAPSAPQPPISPSKKRKLDEDGILLLDSADEKADGSGVDVIEID